MPCRMANVRAEDDDCNAAHLVADRINVLLLNGITYVSEAQLAFPFDRHSRLPIAVMKASVALFAIVALLFLAQSALAHNDGIQRRKAPPSAKVPRLHSVNRPSLRPVPALQSAKASAVTGWAKRLTLPRKLIARPTIDAVGSRPRFVSYGNWQLDSNTIGTPDPKTSLRGLSHYNLAFWVSQGGNATSAGDVTTGSGNAQAWAQGSKTLQRTIVKEWVYGYMRMVSS